MREFWSFYTSQIFASIVVFVININERIERLREVQRVLHWMLDDPSLEESKLLIVINCKKPEPEYLLKKDQLITLLKLNPKNEEKYNHI